MKIGDYVLIISKFSEEGPFEVGEYGIIRNIDSGGYWGLVGKIDPCKSNSMWWFSMSQVQIIPRKVYESTFSQPEKISISQIIDI